MKYKKKPVSVEAFQFDGDLKGSDGKYYVPEWAVKAFEEGILYFDALTPDTPPIELFIRTLEGTMHAPVGSYVIQGVRGEFTAVKKISSLKLMSLSWRVFNVSKRTNRKARGNASRCTSDA